MTVSKPTPVKKRARKRTPVELREKLHFDDDEGDESPEPLDVVAGERKLVTQPYDFSALIHRVDS